MKNILGPRFGAFAIDYTVILLFGSIYARYVGEPTSKGGYQVTGIPALVVPGFWVLSLVVPEWLFGASLGKKILGLKVIQKDGQSLGFGNALLRRACDLFDFWMSFGLVATICHLKNETGQRLGDLAASTVVIKKQN